MKEAVAEAKKRMAELQAQVSSVALVSKSKDFFKYIIVGQDQC